MNYAILIGMWIMWASQSLTTVLWMRAMMKRAKITENAVLSIYGDLIKIVESQQTSLEIHESLNKEIGTVRRYLNVQ